MVRPLLSLAGLSLAVAASCDGSTTDLCDGIDPFPAAVEGNGATTDEFAVEDSAVGGTPWFAISIAVAGFGGRGLMLSALFGEAAGATLPSTCGQLKKTYEAHECCGSPNTKVTTQFVPVTDKYPLQSEIIGSNPCNNAALSVSMPNQKCFAESVADAVDSAAADLDEAVSTAGPNLMGPQSGGDVTENREGGFDTATWYNQSEPILPILGPFHKGAGTEGQNKGLGPLCPVNVHWHLGAEHRSQGEYDEDGISPGRYTETYNSKPQGNYTAAAPPGGGRRLGSDPVRYGFACQLYDAQDQKFNLPYDWKHCEDMQVGETYEVHWPHSVLGACNTPYQYQSKFYDGIFCRYVAAGSPALSPQEIASNVGVQSQVFTIVNDESYYYPDLIKGMIVTDDGEYGRDLAIYAGSSTGTGRDNTWCSMYTPITWQVDRKCHMISASSFDKMCADMKLQADPMDIDLHPHGSRELVSKALNAKVQHSQDHGDSSVAEDGTLGHQVIPR